MCGVESSNLKEKWVEDCGYRYSPRIIPPCTAEAVHSLLPQRRFVNIFMLRSTMSGRLVSFADTPSPFDALHLSQQAPLLLQKPSPTLGALLSFSHTSNETPETWTLYEKLFLSCLQTGDDKSAHLCLERLADRFEPSNERLMSLRGLYREAVAEDDAALTHILKDYEDVLAEDPVNAVSPPPMFYKTLKLITATSRLRKDVSRCSEACPDHMTQSPQSSRS